jgi:hypothetical protein
MVEPMSDLPHLVTLYIDRYGEPSFEVICPGDQDADRSCRMYSEGGPDHVFPGPHGCNCTGFANEVTGETEDCRDCAGAEDGGGHDACGGDWPYVEEIGGPGCMLVPIPGCAIDQYLGEVDEPFAQAEWPREHPIRADVEWVDGYPLLVPFKGEDLVMLGLQEKLRKVCTAYEIVTASDGHPSIVIRSDATIANDVLGVFDRLGSYIVGTSYISRRGEQE